MKTKSSRLESLKKFEQDKINPKDITAFVGGSSIEVECNAAGVLHCDHLDLDTGDFGPDLTIDPTQFKLG
jgi:hypothetical protein